MLRVLVIDDELQIRSLLAQILERAGYLVFTAADGREGLDIFRGERPHVVVTDIVMPEKEGLETIRAMKDLRPEVGIVAISGGGKIPPDPYLAIARKMGAARVISKPFTVGEVLKAVAALAVGAGDGEGGEP